MLHLFLKQYIVYVLLPQIIALSESEYARTRFRFFLFYIAFNSQGNVAMGSLPGGGGDQCILVGQDSAL